MIEGIEALVNWMRLHGCAFWKVYYGSKGSQIVAANDNTNDIEQSIERIKKTFAQFMPGRYVIVCREELDSAKQKGLHEIIYTHTGIASVSNVIVPSNPSMSEDLIQKRIDDAIDKLKTQQKIESLEKENIELNKTIREIQPTLLSNRIATILPVLDPYLPSILEKMGLSKIQSTAIAVSGVSETETYKPDIEQRLEKALEIWAQADPVRFVSLIERFASFAANKPEQYNSYLPMLDSFLQ